MSMRRDDFPFDQQDVARAELIAKDARISELEAVLEANKARDKRTREIFSDLDAVIRAAVLAEREAIAPVLDEASSMLEAMAVQLQSWGVNPVVNWQGCRQRITAIRERPAP